MKKIIREYLENVCFNKDLNTIIFGGQLYGIIAYEYLKDKCKIVSYCDNNKDKVATGVCGKPCVLPENILNKDSVQIIVATSRTYYSDIKQQCSQLGIQNVCYFDEAVMCMEYEKIDVILDSLEDEKSKEIFLASVILRLMGDDTCLSTYCENNTYFAIKEFMLSKIGEVFVDCGAYVGDTIEQLLFSRFGGVKKIYAFEPGVKQYLALINRKKRLVSEWGLEEDQIECIKAGVGKANTVEYICNNNSHMMGDFVLNNTDANVIMNKEQCLMYSIDEYIKDDIDFIKADVEGYEMDVLHGAEKHIKNNKPKLAICIYHYPMDLFEIPLYIKNIMPEYKMKIRHHSFGTTDTVLYCY